MRDAVPLQQGDQAGILRPELGALLLSISELLSERIHYLFFSDSGVRRCEYVASSGGHCPYAGYAGGRSSPLNRS